MSSDPQASGISNDNEVNQEQQKPSTTTIDTPIATTDEKLGAVAVAHNMEANVEDPTAPDMVKLRVTSEAPNRENVSTESEHEKGSAVNAVEAEKDVPIKSFHGGANADVEETEQEETKKEDMEKEKDSHTKPESQSVDNRNVTELEKAVHTKPAVDRENRTSASTTPTAKRDGQANADPDTTNSQNDPGFGTGGDSLGGVSSSSHTQLQPVVFPQRRSSLQPVAAEMLAANLKKLELEQSKNPESNINPSASAQADNSSQALKGPPSLPPTPPRKEPYVDPTPKTPQMVATPLNKELPAVPQGDKAEQSAATPVKSKDSEESQSEIQSMMEQFTGDASEKDEIMSPRLGFAEQFTTYFPPRNSGSDHKHLEQGQPPDESRNKTLQKIRTSSSMHSRPSSAVSAQKRRSSEAPSTPSVAPPPPEQETEVKFDFHTFLEQLRHRTADPVAKFLRSFLIEFGKKQWLVHEQVKLISDFLIFITNKMALCEVWRDVLDVEWDNAKEGMEKLVMNRLYAQTFSPLIPPPPTLPRTLSRSRKRELERIHGPGRRGQHQEDVERDEVLTQKIRIYSWIREQHLDIPPLGSNGKRFLNLAQSELLKITGYRAPRDKVICVLNCCKVIFGLLRNMKNSDTSADSFIPLLIYVVIKANPPNLVSNIQYILRFRNQDKLGGEAGYYLSSLSGAIQFIETLDQTGLTVSDEEFERNVEAAVMSIAEDNRRQELAKHEAEMAEKAEAEAVQSKEAAQQMRNTEDNAPVSGILRTIQKPLTTIGRMFSDEPDSQQIEQRPLSPSSIPPKQSSSTPRLSRDEPRRPTDGRGSLESSRSRPRASAETPRSRVQSTSLVSPEKAQPSTTTTTPRRSATPVVLDAQEAAARQASAEAAEAHRISRTEHNDVVDTLCGMFPNLDREVIDDVVTVKEGHVGLAVDACLVLSAT